MEERILTPEEKRMAIQRCQQAMKVLRQRIRDEREASRGHIWELQTEITWVKAEMESLKRP